MSERPVIGWDCPVSKKGTMTIPHEIREAFGNPSVMRVEFNGKMVVLKCGQAPGEGGFDKYVKDHPETVKDRQ